MAGKIVLTLKDRKATAHTQTVVGHFSGRQSELKTNRMDFLLKVGQAKHIEDMYNNEYLYFNLFKKFTSSEPPAGDTEEVYT
jgi:hypothetical protein